MPGARENAAAGLKMVIKHSAASPMVMLVIFVMCMREEREKGKEKRIDKGRRQFMWKDSEDVAFIKADDDRV